MGRLSSVQKFDRVVETFVAADDQRLGRGEVDALAAYYKGLSGRSQATVKARLVDLYQNADYQAGQKQWFLRSLVAAGIRGTELEGVDPNRAEDFTKMSKEAQFDRLRALAGDWGDGAQREITAGRVPAGARTAINKGVDAFQTAYLKKDREVDEDAFHAQTWHAVYLSEKDGRAEGLVGYTVEQHIYAHDHDVDEMLYFNKKGEYLGSEYHGE